MKTRACVLYACMQLGRIRFFLVDTGVYGSDADKLMDINKKCPICRENATKIVRVYI